MCRGRLQIGLGTCGHGKITNGIFFQRNAQNILQRITGITAVVTLYGDGITLSLGQLLTLVEIECRSQAVGRNGPKTVYRRLDHDALLHRLTVDGHAEGDLQGGVGIDREIGTTPGLGAVGVLFHPEHGQYLGRCFHHFLGYQIVGHLTAELVDHRLLGHRQHVAIGILFDGHQGIVARRNGVTILVSGARVVLGVDHGLQRVVAVAVGGRLGHRKQPLGMIGIEQLHHGIGNRITAHARGQAGETAVGCSTGLAQAGLVQAAARLALGHRMHLLQPGARLAQQTGQGHLARNDRRAHFGR